MGERPMNQRLQRRYALAPIFAFLAACQAPGEIDPGPGATDPVATSTGQVVILGSADAPSQPKLLITRGATPTAVKLSWPVTDKRADGATICYKIYRSTTGCTG